MATTIATISLASSDLLTNALSFSTTGTLTTAGTDTGLSLTTGLARKTTTYSTDALIETTVLYKSDYASTDGANKVYLKNLATDPAQFFTVYIDKEEMGRLYAGDWAFFPWSAKQGTLETFVVTIAGTWVAGESWSFDGITTTAATSTNASIATQVNAQHYPNWTTSIDGAAVTFVAREAGGAGVVTASNAINGDVIVQASGNDATAAITAAAAGTRSESDIIILPSVRTAMTMEHMLIHQ